MSFKNEDDRTSFLKYFTPIVEIKDFIILTDPKSFTDTPIKNKEEAIVEMWRNNDCAIGNLVDYKYFSKDYKLITINLSKQIELGSLDLKQQINFIRTLDEDHATMFFIIEKSENTSLEFWQTIWYIWNGNSKSCKFINWHR